MKFKIDENLPVEVSSLLEENGYDSATVSQQKLRGESDTNIIGVCQREERALLTLDTDFANIRNYPPKDYFGLIVLRLKKQDKTYILSVVDRLIKLLPKELLEHHLWIVDEKRIRISGK